MQLGLWRLTLLVAGVASGSASAVALAQTPGQTRARPPVFAPDDREGLVVSPNPGIRHAWKRPVHWKSTLAVVAETGVPPATAAERAAIVPVLETISAMLRATPEGTSGQGFWVNEDRRIVGQPRYDLPPEAPMARWPLTFEVGFYPFYHEDVNSRGTWRLSVNGETASAYFHVNRHPGEVGRPVIVTEDRGRDHAPTAFYLRPRETGRFGGLVVYEDQILVAARPGRELWAPAPLGRLMRGALPRLQEDAKTAERRLDGYRATNAEVQAPEWEAKQRAEFEKNNGALRTTRPQNYALRQQNMERYIRLKRDEAAAAANPPRDATGAWYWNPVDALAETTQRLQALSAADAARPACYAEYTTSPAKEGRYQLRGRLDVVGASPDCVPVVMTDWSYFDLKLPRSAVQLLVLRDFGRCTKLANGQLTSNDADNPPIDVPLQGCGRHVRMWRDADWSRALALVVP